MVLPSVVLENNVDRLSAGHHGHAPNRNYFPIAWRLVRRCLGLTASQDHRASGVVLDRGVLTVEFCVEPFAKRSLRNTPPSSSPIPAQADLGAQPPFCTGVRDPEPLTLGIALGIAARLCDHHRKIASAVEGVVHTLVKERRLQPTTPQLRNRSRAAEQSNAIMNAQHASGTRFPVMFGEEAQTVPARRRYGTEI